MSTSETYKFRIECRVISTNKPHYHLLISNQIPPSQCPDNNINHLYQNTVIVERIPMVTTDKDKDAVTTSTTSSNLSKSNSKNSQNLLMPQTTSNKPRSKATTPNTFSQYRGLL